MEATVQEGLKKPRTDLSTCIGNPILLFVKDPQALAALKLPFEGGQLECRLVGVERQGIWFEPDRWVEAASQEKKPLHHVFLQWEDVLSIMKAYETSDLEGVRQYRGLRPRS